MTCWRQRMSQPTTGCSTLSGGIERCDGCEVDQLRDMFARIRAPAGARTPRPRAGHVQSLLTKTSSQMPRTSRRVPSRPSLDFKVGASVGHHVPGGLVASHAEGREKAGLTIRPGRSCWSETLRSTSRQPGRGARRSASRRPLRGEALNDRPRRRPSGLGDTEAVLAPSWGKVRAAWPATAPRSRHRLVERGRRAASRRRPPKPTGSSSTPCGLRRPTAPTC